MKIRDRVYVIGVPDDLPLDDDQNGLNTTSLFQKCLDRSFSIAGFNDQGLVELEVGDVTGQPSYMSSIWIEPRFLAVILDQA